MRRAFETVALDRLDRIGKKFSILLHTSVYTVLYELSICEISIIFMFLNQEQL